MMSLIVEGYFRRSPSISLLLVFFGDSTSLPSLPLEYLRSSLVICRLATRFPAMEGQMLKASLGYRLTALDFRDDKLGNLRQWNV